MTLGTERIVVSKDLTIAHDLRNLRISNPKATGVGAHLNNRGRDMNSLLIDGNYSLMPEAVWNWA